VKKATAARLHVELKRGEIVQGSRKNVNKITNDEYENIIQEEESKRERIPPGIDFE
jgi:hypothetical protein